MAKKIALLILTLLLNQTLAQAQNKSSSEIDYMPEITEFENKIETLSKEILKDFLGSETRVVVRAQVSVATPKSPSFNPLDVGYLPFPTNLDSEKLETLKIKSVDLSVLLPKTFDELKVSSVKNLLSSSFSKYPLNLSVETADFFDGIDKKEESIIDWLNKYLNQILLFLAILGAVLGALLLSQGFKGGLIALAEGIRSLTQTTSQIKSGDSPIQMEHLLDKEDIENSKPTNQEDLSNEEKRNNIEAFKDLLSKDPIAFLKSFGGESDSRGLKWLLPQLTEPERILIYKLLGDGQIKEIQNLSDGDFVPNPWFQEFIERIVLNHISQKGLMQQALGAEKVSNLLSLDKKTLKKVLLELNVPAAWRLGAEILPEEELELLTQQSKESVWNAIIDSASVDEEELRSAYESLTSNFEKNSDKDLGTDVDYLDNKVYKILINTVRSKPIGEDEIFVEQLTQKSNDLAAKIKEDVWLPSRLSEIPESYLKGVITTEDVEVVFSLVYAFPDPWGDKFRKFLPEGNKKVILEDLITRAEKNAEESEKQAAFKVAREFLDRLQQEHKNGVFQLQVDEPSTLKAVS